MCVHTQAHARAWRSEDDWSKSVLPFYRVGSRDQTQKGLYSLSQEPSHHPTGPFLLFPFKFV